MLKVFIVTKENSQRSDGIHPGVLMELAEIVLESLAITLQNQWKSQAPRAGKL